MNARTAVWVLPVEEDRQRFGKIIAGISRTHGTPVFEPHVTVYVDSSPWYQGGNAFLARAAEGTGRFLLSTEGFGMTEDFTRSLFVRLQGDRTLSDLSRRCGVCSSEGGPYRLDPHLSLAYGYLSGGQKMAIIAGIRGLPEEIAFGSICAVRIPGGPVRSHTDVERWQEIGRITLGD